MIALFWAISKATKHDHWKLDKGDAKTLSEALNDALLTLPSASYAKLIQIFERWVPWANLAFVIGAIVGPRIEQSKLAAEKLHYQPNTREYTGPPGSSPDNFDNVTSLGWSDR